MFLRNLLMNHLERHNSPIIERVNVLTNVDRKVILSYPQI